MKRFMIYSTIISAMMFGVICLTGCDMSDPDGTVQAIAQDANAVLDTVNKIAPAVSPFVPPKIKEVLLAVIAVAGAVVGAIQSLKKKKGDTVTKQIVVGLDAAIEAGAVIVKGPFTEAMNKSQDEYTRKVVNNIQGKRVVNKP